MGHNCCNKQKVKRGLWSSEEDDCLMQQINTHGHGSWSSVAKQAGLQRCGKSCRLRWINYLRPDLKRGSFSKQEERIIIDVHRILGNRWAQIAKHLPGRTDNEVKNFWNSCIKKKLIAQGLDPNTHNLPPLTNYSACNFSPTLHNSMDMKALFHASPYSNTSSPNYTSIPTNPYLLHDSSSTISTYEYQNPSMVWSSTSTLQEQPSMGMSVPMPSSSHSSYPSEFGIINEKYCKWGTSSFELIADQPTKPEEILMQQVQQEEKANCEVEDEKANVLLIGGHTMDASYGSSNFDCDSVESTLVPFGMYYHPSPMDQLAWN